MSYADITGTWKIDVEKTLEFNASYAKVSVLWISLLKCLAENSTLIINKDFYNSISIGHTCTHEGKRADIEGYRYKYPYKKVFQNSNDTVLVTMNEDGNENQVVFHFIDDNLIWNYYGGNPPKFESHVRYYYKRQK
jgi:hypothetical protein